MRRNWDRQTKWLRLAIVVAGVVLLAVKFLAPQAAFQVADQILANVPTMDESEPKYPPTPQFAAASTEGITPVGGLGLGISCSVPPLIINQLFERADNEATIDLQMRQACAFHDYCYRHGNATYGYTQADCDSLLQQHSFRLCRFNTISPQARQQKCMSRARLIVLGVRAGGAQSFQTQLSTPFEFDPYPQVHQPFTVHRVADASPAARERGAVGKSVYTFQVSQAGLQVEETSWDAKRQPLAKPIVMQLNGRFGRITTPPMVIKSSRGDDVFLWWQRFSFNTTAGRFFAVVPGMADEADWAHYSDATRMKSKLAQRPNNKRPNTCSQDKAYFNPVPNYEAWAETQEMDCYLSEYQPLQAREDMQAPKSLVLFGLRTSPCNIGDSTHCFMHIRLSFNGNRLLVNNADGFPLESMRARTRQFDKQTGRKLEIKKGEPQEPDRYRAFVTAPKLEGGDRPIVHFYKRGDALGVGFSDELIVRRFATYMESEPPRQRVPGKKPVPYTGVSLGRVVLEGLRELDEPHLLFTHDGKATYLTYSAAQPVVYSKWQPISEPQSGMVIKLWPMPTARQERFEEEEIDRQALLTPSVSEPRVVAAETVPPCAGQTRRGLPVPLRPFLPLQLRNGDVGLVFWNVRHANTRRNSPRLFFTAVGVRVDMRKKCYRVASGDRLDFGFREYGRVFWRYALVPTELDGDGRLDLLLVDRHNPSQSSPIYDVRKALGFE